MNDIMILIKSIYGGDEMAKEVTNDQLFEFMTKMYSEMQVMQGQMRM